MCHYIYNWNIVACNVKQPISSHHIGQTVKRRRNPVFAFNMQNTTKPFTRSGRVLVVFCLLKTNTGLRTSSFCYLSNIDISQYVIQYSAWTRQNTLYFIILKLLPLEVKVHVYVCIKVTLKGKLLVETNLSWTCLVSGLLNFEYPSVLLFCLIKPG